MGKLPILCYMGDGELNFGKGHVDSVHVCKVGIFKGDDGEISS